MKKVIAISLSPNVFLKDIMLALQTLVTPWTYYDKTYVIKLQEWFKTFFTSNFAFSYTSGRAGLYELLQAYGVNNEDEVLLQAFTCVALPNAITAIGATPIYVDVLANATIDPEDLEKKITQKSKVIIIQHTFGIPSEVEKISAIAKKHGLIIIEDCAHGIGIPYKNKLLGQFGDSAFFSFGRDKAFSSVFGGMVITNNSSLAKILEKQHAALVSPSIFWIAQQLFHPIAFSCIVPVYDMGSLGKVLVVLFQKLHMLSFPVTASEKKGKYEVSDTKKLPGALARLAYAQLQRLELFNKKRESIAQMYIHAFGEKKEQFLSGEKLPYLRFSMLSPKRDHIIAQMRKSHIYLGKWYTSPIDPKGVNFATIQYSVGSCPMAEKIANEIFNVPTYPTMSDDDVKNVIAALQRYV